MFGWGVAPANFGSDTHTRPLTYSNTAMPQKTDAYGNRAMTRDDWSRSIYGRTDKIQAPNPEHGMGVTDWIRPDEFTLRKRVGEITKQVIIRSLRKSEMWMVHDVLPWASLPPNHKIAMETIKFHNTSLEEVPEKGRSRLLKKSFKSFERSAERYGKAFQMEQGFANTEAGMEEYWASCKQIYEGTLMTMILRGLYEIMSCNIRDSGKWLSTIAGSGDLAEQLFEFEKRTWSIFSKTKDGLTMLARAADEIMSSRSVDPDTWILPKGSRAYLGGRTENTSFAEAGYTALQNKVNPEAWTDKILKGNRIYECHKFRTEEDAAAEDPLKKQAVIGQMHFWDGNNTKFGAMVFGDMQRRYMLSENNTIHGRCFPKLMYSTAGDIFTYFDERADDYATLSKREAVRYSGIIQNAHSSKEIWRLSPLGHDIFSRWATVGDYLESVGWLDEAAHYWHYATAFGRNSGGGGGGDGRGGGDDGDGGKQPPHDPPRRFLNAALNGRTFNCFPNGHDDNRADDRRDDGGASGGAGGHEDEQPSDKMDDREDDRNKRYTIVWSPRQNRPTFSTALEFSEENPRIAYRRNEGGYNKNYPSEERWDQAWGNLEELWVTILGKTSDEAPRPNISPDDVETWFNLCGEIKPVIEKEFNQVPFFRAFLAQICDNKELQAALYQHDGQWWSDFVENIAVASDLVDPVDWIHTAEEQREVNKRAAAEMGDVLEKAWPKELGRIAYANRGERDNVLVFVELLMKKAAWPAIEQRKTIARLREAKTRLDEMEHAGDEDMTAIHEADQVYREKVQSAIATTQADMEEVWNQNGRFPSVDLCFQELRKLVSATESWTAYFGYNDAARMKDAQKDMQRMLSYWLGTMSEGDVLETATAFGNFIRIARVANEFAVKDHEEGGDIKNDVPASDDHDGMIARWKAMFYSLPIEKIATLFKEHLMKNIPIPGSFYLIRPWQTYDMKTAIRMKRGSETGNTYLGENNFAWASEAGRKTLFGHFTVYGAAVVREPDNVLVLRNVMCEEYIRGGGSKIFDPLDDIDVHNVKTGNNNKDIFICFELPNIKPERSYIDITGALPEYINTAMDQEHVAKHYTFCEEYTNHWGWEQQGKDTYLPSMTPYFVESGRGGNTLCFQAWQKQKVYDGFEVREEKTLGRGHWGPNTYPGVVEDRCGRGNGYVQTNQHLEVS